MNIGDKIRDIEGGDIYYEGMTPQKMAEHIFGNIKPNGHNTLNNKEDGINWIKKQYNRMPHKNLNTNGYNQEEINDYWKETERILKLLPKKN